MRCHLDLSYQTFKRGIETLITTMIGMSSSLGRALALFQKSVFNFHSLSIFQSLDNLSAVQFSDPDI